MGAWPIVARDAESARIVADLLARPARSHMLRGPSGIGKTTLAASVARAATSSGRTVVPVVALAELRDVPLGALAPLLGSSRVAQHDDVSARLQELMSIVGSHADAYLLVVDDAPLLDTASASALYQLVRVFGVPTLMTARDEHEITGALARLLHEDLVTVVDLDGLDLDQSRELLKRHLGAEVRPETLRRMFDTTRGNPLFLRELTLAAERADAVRSGPYGLEIDPAPLPSHILTTVAGRIAALRPELRVYAQLLAVAQPWPPGASRADESNIIADLREAGIVTGAGPEGSGYLQLAHPVFAEALLADLSTTERADRRREAGSRLLELGEAQLRFTALCMLCDAGVEVDSAELVWAASYAHAAGDHERAVTLAQRVVSDQDASAAALVLGSAFSALGRAADAAEAFERATEHARTDNDRALVLLRWGQHTALRLHDPAAAIARTAPALATLDPEAAALVTPDLAKWRLMVGDAEVLDAPIAAADGGDGAAALSAAIGQAMMATMSGQVEQARLAVEAGRPLAASFAHVMPFAGSLLDLSAFLTHVGDGRIAEATAFAEERRLQPLADSAGVWSYALALVRLHAGRLHDALTLAVLAVDQLRWRDFTGLLAPALALAATVHAQLGHAAEARALLSQIDAAQFDDVKVVLQAAEAETWMLVTAGDDDEAGAVIAPAVARGVELGHFVLVALTATIAVRAGHAAAVQPLVRVAEKHSASALITAVAATVDAVTERDAEAVMALASSLTRAGLVAFAHDVLRTAEQWPGVDRMLARRISVAAAELGRDQEFVERSRTVWQVAGLTEREWVIAQAAARRERSREIAESLGVSVRTIDNHLSNIYRKLGISGRAELEAELREYLEPPG